MNISPEFDRIEKNRSHLKAIEKWNGILRKLLEPELFHFIGSGWKKKINSDFI